MLALQALTPLLDKIKGMIFNYKYSGSSKVESNANSTGMSFAPDTFREPTFFRGTLSKNIPFREAISALHDVVVSDLRYQPKDREEYKIWAAKQEENYLQEMVAQNEETKAKIGLVQRELNDLHKTSSKVMKPFYDARQKYFKYLYQKDRDAWFVLDPVITVHPDEVFFECFSQDESSYGRLGCSYEVFKNINEFECGTTNIDYSDALYKEFQKIRDYKTTDFVVDPSGFQVDTQNEDSFKELKIDLPDSWVRGFLQVSSAMTLDAVEFDLHPMDIHNFCFILKRYKEKKGPRSIRFHLKPGEPVRVVFEPWGYELVCARSIYHGTSAKEIRIWGRRRLLILERLIPVAKSFKVKLLGTGLPSFFIADLGDMNFTLGLSGWTKNDWSRAGNFDLMAPRADVDLFTKTKIFESLKEDWFASAADLSRKMKLDRAVIQGALSAYTQAGKVMYDMNKKKYRIRELSKDPLPFEQLRFSNEREQVANELLAKGKVNTVIETLPEHKIKMNGEVQDQDKKIQTELIIDSDQRLVEAKCQCRFFLKNKLYKGPCEHILATRLKFSQRR